MRILWTTVVILGFITGSTVSGLARTNDGQDLPPLPARTIPLADSVLQAPAVAVPDAARRQDELQQWINDFSEWKAWMARWGNRREPGWFSDSRERRQRPVPPEWLFERCGYLEEDIGTTAEACTLLAEWRADYATTQATTARVALSSNREDEHKTIWWEHVHLDVGWPAMQSGVSLYGVVGMHATTNVAGRLEIFVAPGAMLLNVPTRNGARAWKLATNYGIAYRLGQFSIPGNRRALLHVNLAKAWLLSAGPDVATRSTDFVGFSITFNKRRQ
jgi:hypothetical protein